MQNLSSYPRSAGRRGPQGQFYDGPSRRVSLVALLPALTMLVGCGESRIEVVPVSGRVTFAGQPPAGAQIVLHPANTSNPSDVAPSGRVGNDGSFTITAYEQGDGAPPGEYVATIQWYKIDPKEGIPGPNVIPEEYAKAATSPIKVTVNQAPTVLQPITIPAKSLTAQRPTTRR
jgi:hypothetical protein